MRLALSIATGLCLLAVAVPGFTQDQKKPTKQPPRGGQRGNASQFFQRLDKNKDGFIQLSEAPPQLRDRLRRYDANKDGKVSKEEMQKARRQFGGGGKPGEVNTRPARGERHADKLKVGDKAPDFTLKDPSGKREVTLSSFQGKKPVVLIFGSYT